MEKLRLISAVVFIRCFIQTKAIAVCEGTNVNYYSKRRSLKLEVEPR